MTASLYQIPTLDAITNFPYCEFPVTSLDLKEILLLCEVLAKPPRGARARQQLCLPPAFFNV